MLADGEAVWAPRRPLALMLVDAEVAFQPRVALRSGGPEHEALGELLFFCWATGEPPTSSKGINATVTHGSASTLTCAKTSNTAEGKATKMM